MSGFDFDLLKELKELFGIKEHPQLVSFWFCRAEYVEDKTADFPEDFEQYTLYRKKKFWADDKLWCCYAKKECRGLISDRYWKTKEVAND